MHRLTSMISFSKFVNILPIPILMVGDTLQYISSNSDFRKLLNLEETVIQVNQNNKQLEVQI